MFLLTNDVINAEGIAKFNLKKMKVEKEYPIAKFYEELKDWMDEEKEINKYWSDDRNVKHMSYMIKSLMDLYQGCTKTIKKLNQFLCPL